MRWDLAYLFTAPLGTDEPTDLTTEWTDVDAGWVGLGYTETGSEFDYQLQTAAVMVAEELDTIKNAPTGRQSSVTFDLAQMTATNLQLASNGGTITSGGGDRHVRAAGPRRGSPLHVGLREPKTARSGGCGGRPS